MIPNLFWKSKIPDKLPDSMQEVVNHLKKSKDKKDCLRMAYDALAKKHVGCKIYQRFFDLFTSDVSYLWYVKQQHCTGVNYLLRVLLVKSKFFKDEDITLNIAPLWCFPIHQYLSVRVSDDKTINVDPWSARLGTKFGDYAHGFHLKS